MPGNAIARADSLSAAQALAQARSFYRSGQYFDSARYAFAAADADSASQAEGYSWITLSLIQGGFPNASVYFFIRTLQSGNPQAIQRVLTKTQALFALGGVADLLRKYLIQYTAYNDYDLANRSAYLYSLGKDALLTGRLEAAVGYFNGIQRSSPVWPYALQLRGSALALLGRATSNDEAIADFRACQDRAEDIEKGSPSDSVRRKQLAREAADLRARCTAGEGRVLYQADRFEEADRVYDRIPKGSLVWPDILFEQAWNSFARQEYNRTLGKLVSYKSPALEFVFNTENDVLRAQSYLMLCLYNDANTVINDFNSRYAKVGEQVKHFVERNARNLPAFFAVGKAALHQSLYTPELFYRFMDRFVRSPYFQELVSAEKDSQDEMASLRKLSSDAGAGSGPGALGFSGFMSQVLRWRIRAIQSLGGAFVKNSMLDYHQALLADFEKMAFIKLEMLKRAKDKLIYKNHYVEDRSRGNVIPSRRDDQFYWSFNGEFWDDELGDYVFGLESECGRNSSG